MVTEPQADLPYMPGYDEMIEASGGKTLPWSWAEGRIAACRNLWLTTVRPGGAPHMMPVWGVWLDGVFGFSTSSGSRKARNFRANPQVAVATDDGAEAVIIEGEVGEMPAASHKAFIAAYKNKYDWQLEESWAPFYIVRPRVAFGIREYGDREIGGVTRWTFDQG
jgi:nitroimidazol reductase NimA-like FMN-containing flavoprotein (pyridoxamine 5'-phosphate oxidase superfamily)